MWLVQCSYFVCPFFGGYIKSLKRREEKIMKLISTPCSLSLAILCDFPRFLLAEQWTRKLWWCDLFLARPVCFQFNYVYLYISTFFAFRRIKHSNTMQMRTHAATYGHYSLTFFVGFKCHLNAVYSHITTSF